MRSAVELFYAVVRVIARFWIWFFFERVEVRHPERVPCMGPVLLCINHPNNLIDSLLIGSVLSRGRCTTSPPPRSSAIRSWRGSSSPWG